VPTVKTRNAARLRRGGGQRVIAYD
jgi:hypothetical protein